MAVYDDQKQKTGVSDDELRNITGIPPDEEAAMEREAYNGAADDIGEKSVSAEDLADAEKSGATQGATEADKSEAPESESDGGFYRSEDDSSSGRFKITRKKGVTGAIIGLILGGGFGIFGLLQGPLQIIHIAQILSSFHGGPNDESSKSRVGRLYENLRTQDDKSKRNVGFLAEKITNKYIGDMKTQGIELNFDNPDGKSTRRIQSITIDSDSPQGKAAIDRLKAQGIEVPDANGGKVNIDFRSSGVANTATRRAALNSVVDFDGKGKVASAVSKRLLAQRAGVDFHPFKNAKRTAGEKMSDFFKKRQQAYAEQARTGDQDLLNRNTTQDPNDPNNTETAPTDPDVDIIENDAENLIDEAKNANTPELKKGLVTKLGGGALALVGVLCVVRETGQQVEAAQHAQVVLPMIRMAMQIATMGSQIMTGQGFNLDEVGSVVDTFYDEENKSSIMSGRAMQAVQKQDLTGPDTSIKPSTKNEKPEFFQIIDSIPTLGSICAVQSGIGAIFSNTPVVGSLINGISGGLIGVLDAAVKAASGQTLTAWMSDLVGFMAGAAVDTNAIGAPKGNYVGIGYLLAENDTAIGKGSRALTKKEAMVLRDRAEASRIAEFKSRGFLERTFSIQDDQSVLARAIIDAPRAKNSGQQLSNIARLPMSIIGMFTSGFAKLSPDVSAAEGYQDYDFGVNAYGFSQGELDNEELSDPYAVAEYVEPKLKDLNEKYGDCFGNTVNPDNFSLIVQEAPEYNKVSSSECNDGSTDLKYYRMYLLDTITIRSMACYEGLDDESCSEMGFGTQQQSATPTGSIAISEDGFVFPLKTTQKTIINNPGGSWCYKSTENCHHDYNAADIMAPTGTEVVAARGGRVVSAKDNDESKVGSRVTIMGDDGKLYYYAHMGDGTIKVSNDDTVSAGQVLGRVGTKADAVGTNTHLHFDVLPQPFIARPSCSGSECTVYPFINIQPTLVKVFNLLP